jgi:hypothetical protein
MNIKQDSEIEKYCSRPGVGMRSSMTLRIFLENHNVQYLIAALLSNQPLRCMGKINDLGLEFSFVEVRGDEMRDGD